MYKESKEIVNKDNRSRHRSSNGCLTCRKRKKKCDELSFPTCQNCQVKGLQCIWKQKTKELYRHMGNVKYFGDDEILRHKSGNQSHKRQKTQGSSYDKPPNNSINDDKLTLPHKTLNPQPTPSPLKSLPIKDNKIKSFDDLTKYDYDYASVKDGEYDINEYIDFQDKKSFLERIALQQDIVDD